MQLNKLSTHKRSARTGVGVFVTYLLLLALIIPWYWPAGDLRRLYGIPFWALASLGAAFATAALTAWICLRRREPRQ